jgi:flagellar hook assembly protein FlgD
MGQIVRKFFRAATPAGIHSVRWDGKNADGIDVASGLYFYTINTEKYRESKAMLLIK